MSMPAQFVKAKQSRAAMRTVRKLDEYLELPWAIAKTGTSQGIVEFSWLASRSFEPNLSAELLFPSHLQPSRHHLHPQVRRRLLIRSDQ